MKLRLKGNQENSLRLRLSRTDLARLVSGEDVVEVVRLGGGRAFRYALCSGGDRLAAVADAHSVTISVPKASLARWSGETEVGIYETLREADGTVLQVVLEKDFACLDRGEDDNHDTFAHPQTGAAC